jgi:hypothetical protein
MGFIYYKQELQYSLIVYYVNQATHSIEGMYSEHRNNNMRSVRRNIDTSMWTNVETNELAQELIRTSVVISKDEYETITGVIDGSLEIEYWISSGEKIGDNIVKENKKEVVAETVIC